MSVVPFWFWCQIKELPGIWGGCSPPAYCAERCHCCFVFLFFPTGVVETGPFLPQQLSLILQTVKRALVILTVAGALWEYTCVYVGSGSENCWRSHSCNVVLPSQPRFRLDSVHRYLTNGQPSVERFPISFKTHFSGNYFHHVVLGIYCNGRYGSLGMSRRSDLMDKPLTYRTLSDLIFEFEDSYKKYLHSVKKVKIGLYVPHEPHSFQPIEWKQLVLNVSKMMRTEVRKELEKFARDMRMKVGLVPGFSYRISPSAWETLEPHILPWLSRSQHSDCFLHVF